LLRVSSRPGDLLRPRAPLVESPLLEPAECDGQGAVGPGPFARRLPGCIARPSAREGDERIVKGMVERAAERGATGDRLGTVLSRRRTAGGPPSAAAAGGCRRPAGNLRR